MSFLDILKILLPMLFILGLLYGALYLVRKYSFSFGNSKTNLLNIKIISTQMLMPKKFITVVKVEESLLLLGVSEHSITLLKELDFPVSDEELQNIGAQTSGLSDLIKKNLGIK